MVDPSPPLASFLALLNTRPLITDRLLSIFPRSNLRFPFHHPSRRHAQMRRFPKLLQRGLYGYLGRQRGERSDQPMEHPACQRDNIESQQGRQGVGCCKRSLKGKDAAIILEEGRGHIFIEMGERGYNLMFWRLLVVLQFQIPSGYRIDDDDAPCFYYRIEYSF